MPTATEFLQGTHAHVTRQEQRPDIAPQFCTNTWIISAISIRNSHGNMRILVDANQPVPITRTHSRRLEDYFDDDDLQWITQTLITATIARYAAISAAIATDSA